MIKRIVIVLLTLCSFNSVVQDFFLVGFWAFFRSFGRQMNSEVQLLMCLS